MTSEAILGMLDHLCNEARNTMHATFGLMEFQPEASAGPAWQTCLDASRSSADRLLATMDDIREMVSGEAPAVGSVEEIDLPLCVGETAALMNLTTTGGAAKLMVECRDEPLRIRQNRQVLEQVLARVLKLALALSPIGVVRVAVGSADLDRVRIDIVPPSPEVARQLAEWLNGGLEQVNFDEGNVATLVSALVAGRRLRSAGGTAEFECHAGGFSSLAMYLPRQTDGVEESSYPAAVGKPLQVLVAEDCDESYALTELLLRGECVDRARNGREAVDKVMKRRFDIVFMDVHMPGLGGYDSIRAIRQWETQSANARTPIVILSSDDIATQKRCAAQSGCTGFLRKPIRQSDLVDLLDPLRPPARSLFDSP